MAVFPFLGSYGATDEYEYMRLRRRYDDGSMRVYKRSNFKHHRLTLRFESYTKAQKDTIQAFLEAREVDGATFTVYSPFETFVHDPTGAASTGKHTANEIVGDTWSWSLDSNCRYSGEITFFLID